MEQYKKQNLRQFKILHNKQYIQIQPQQALFKTQILIDKAHHTIVFEKKQKKFAFDNEPIIIFCSLILGVLNIKGSYFLVYADNVYKQFVLEPENALVYQIASIDFIPFHRIDKGQEQAILLTLKKEVFSFGFYFSFERDLTLRSQLYYSGNSKNTVEKFFWNQTFLQGLIQNKNASEWKIPVIQGYYTKFENFQNQHKITYYLIARRSKIRSGTRFYSRGIDQSGHCSNSIQTQQFIIADKILMSVVFISGSSPIFWQQKSQSKPIKLTRNKQLTKVPFVEHIKTLNSQYGNILLINLLESKKQSQKFLTQAYQQIFNETQPEIQQCCRYLYFDINDALKQNNYHSIDQVINHKLEDIMSCFGCFIYDFSQKSVKAKQQGIFRVSCLDCLRRTGIFLQSLALKTLYIQFSLIGCHPPQFTINQILKQNNQQQFNSLTKNFNLIWSKKADYESLIYSGTRAVSGRKDKLLDQIDNSFVAIQRLYNEKFMDRMKQTVIDLMNPKKKSIMNKSSVNHSSSDFNVSIITWNVNATQPDKLNLDPLVKKYSNADLLVFGIQQMIDLQPNNVMSEQQESKMAKYWQKYLNLKLSEHYKQKFIFLQKLEMVGILLLVFISQDWKGAIRSVHKDTVKTGYGGTFGNKGGVVIRVNIYDTSLCFTCAHLAAGESKVKERLDDFVQIHKKAFQQNKEGVQNQLQIEESDHKFFFGDLNFRIKGEFKSFSDLMEITRNPTQKYQEEIDKLIGQLYDRDQLLSIRMQSQTPYFISVYEQEKIKFLPTYKLQKSTGYYTLQKSRNPSWCDRILYWSDNLEEHSFQCKQYTAINVQGSDHRPVYGSFTVTVLKQQTKRESLRDFGQQIVGKEFRDSFYDN